MAFMPDVGFFLWAWLSIAMNCRENPQAEYDNSKLSHRTLLTYVSDIFLSETQ